MEQSALRNLSQDSILRVSIVCNAETAIAKTHNNLDSKATLNFAAAVEREEGPHTVPQRPLG